MCPDCQDTGRVRVIQRIGEFTHEQEQYCTCPIGQKLQEPTELFEDARVAAFDRILEDIRRESTYLEQPALMNLAKAATISLRAIRDALANNLDVPPPDPIERN